MLILVLLERSILNHHTQNMFLRAGTCFWVTCLSPLNFNLPNIILSYFFGPLKYDYGRYRAPEVLLQSSTYSSAVGQYIPRKRLKFYEVQNCLWTLKCFNSIFSLQICGQWVLSWPSCLLSVLSFQDRGTFSFLDIGSSLFLKLQISALHVVNFT